ncbi:unnamed protein product, partial [Closterium sp. NIES-65]
MDDLISLGETLQQASSALVGDDIQADPRSGSAPVIQLLVIGAPPTGEGGCTRFPVLVDLHRDQNLSAGSVRANLGPRTNMPKPSEIRQALQSDMSKAKGSSRHREEAQLILRSPIGLSDNVSNNDAVILVVISATAVKDSLKILRIAHDIDKEGVRTIGVITKFDQVMKDRDTAKLAVDLLQKQGAAMAQDYPWVAVIGQPLGDKDTNEPMDGAWQEEYKVLSQVMRANGVKGMDTPMGRDALLRLIARTVRHKMKEKIPRIMSALESRLEGRSQEVDAELLRLGDSLVTGLNGSGALALELCRGFEKLMSPGLPSPCSRQLGGSVSGGGCGATQAGRLPRHRLEGRSQEVDAELLRLGDSLVSSLNGSRALALELCRGFETKFCEHLDGSEVRALGRRHYGVLQGGMDGGGRGHYGVPQGGMEGPGEGNGKGCSSVSNLNGSRALALELCRGFETKFCEHLDGSEVRALWEGGGSQMVEKFVGTLPLRFRGLPLDDMFSFDNVKKGLPLDDMFSFGNVKKVVMVADGYQPYLLSPEKGLRLLIKRSLELAKQPGIDCVDEVHKILVDIVAGAASQAPSLVRFPPMKTELVGHRLSSTGRLVAIASAALDEYRAEAKRMVTAILVAIASAALDEYRAEAKRMVTAILVAIASAALDEYRAEAKRMVTAIVDMEKGFVPPSHFIEAEYKRQEKMWKELEVARKGLQDRGVLSRSSTGDSGGGRFASAMSSFSRKKEPPPPPPSADISHPLSTGDSGGGRFASAMSSFSRKKEPPPPPPPTDASQPLGPVKELAGAVLF